MPLTCTNEIITHFHFDYNSIYTTEISISEKEGKLTSLKSYTRYPNYCQQGAPTVVTSQPCKLPYIHLPVYYIYY